MFQDLTPRGRLIEASAAMSNTISHFTAAHDSLPDWESKESTLGDEVIHRELVRLIGQLEVSRDKIEHELKMADAIDARRAVGINIDRGPQDQR